MNYTAIKKAIIDYSRKGLLSVLVIGLFLNLILKDHVWLLSGIYYLLPLKILLITSIIYLALSFKDKLHRKISIVMILFISLIILISDSGFIENNLPPKLILWNIARDKTTSEEIADFVNKHKAEVYTFIEFDNEKKENAEKGNLDKLLPDFDIHHLSGNMAMLVKNGSEFIRIDSLNDRYNFFNIVEANGIKYAVVDIGSWPFYNRSKPFKMLYRLVSKYNVDIILGDFNTPYTSVYFKKFFDRFNCGITENRFNRETFPSIFPLVSLDNILVSKRFKITKYQPEKFFISDHYPMLLNYE